MRLTELNARWIGSGGTGITDQYGKPVPWRPSIGVIMRCPCDTQCGTELFVAFENPLDGLPPPQGVGNTWKREGETIETLTLKPSIQRRGGCNWHGFIEDGATRKA